MDQSSSWRRWGSLVAALVRGFNRAFAEPYGSTQVQQPPGTAPLSAFYLFLGGFHVGTVQFSTYCRGCMPPPHQNRPGNNSVRHHFSECFAAACNLQSLPTYRYKLICACSPLSSFFSWRLRFCCCFLRLKMSSPKTCALRKTPPQPEKPHLCA